jgi:oxalate decarboxylase/phosphoglucose isomerase-like protein (cupin superfamily)
MKTSKISEEDIGFIDAIYVHYCENSGDDDLY